MEDKLKKDILHLEGLLGDLRSEFRRVDIQNRGVLSPQQLYQALLNLNIQLSQEELMALMDVVDKDRSGTVDIDEFIGFIITSPKENSFGTEADAAIVNILRTRKISLLDVMESYKFMPFNFMGSFTRDLTRKLLNLPSSTFKPKLNASGAFYEDVFPNINKNTSTGLKRTTTQDNSYEILPKPSALSAEIVLTLAKGIPIPADNDKNVNRQASIIGREVRGIIFSKTQKKFVGNIVNIPVEWDPEFEDQWKFTPTKAAGENSIFIRMLDFNPTREYDTGLILVFEFVIFFRRNDQIIEMSSGWADIELNELKLSRPLELKLKGGSPLREVTISTSDVRANRTGWRQLVKKLSAKPTTSKLKIEVKAVDRLTPEQKTGLEFMPAMVLLNKNALNIAKIYRNYLGSLYREAVEKGTEVDLANDVLARTFRKTVDCPNTWTTVVDFWNLSVNPIVSKTKDVTLSISYLKKLLRNLYMMFVSSEFRFTDTDPTLRIENDVQLLDTRKRILRLYLDSSLSEMQLGPAGRSSILTSASTQSSFKPFSINELLEDESDASFLDQLRNIKSNVTSTTKTMLP